MARDDRLQCAKCGGDMEEGFVISPPFNNSPVGAEDWVAGQPEPSFWTGTKLRGKARHHVATYRCERCGFLESYAR